jgi:hypothetical protein
MQAATTKKAANNGTINKIIIHANIGFILFIHLFMLFPRNKGLDFCRGYDIMDF